LIVGRGQLENSVLRMFRLVITDKCRYPDTGDRVTSSFIQQREPYPGY
jgi:hypothetical protein